MLPPSLPELQSELSKYFGFRVPQAFAQFIQHGIAESSKEGFFNYWTFLDYFHFFDFNLPLTIEHDSEKDAWT